MYDAIIIGAGAAGLSAALWCEGLGLDVLVLEAGAEVGGQLLNVYNPINNYLGLRAANGRELRDLFRAQIADCEFDLWTETEIESVDLKTRSITLGNGEKLQAISLLLATGVRRKRLGIPGEAELAGRGVVDSVMRDRERLAGRDICVIGGGDAAAENALLLAEVCPTVTLVHRGKRLSARTEFSERLQAEHCITIFKESAAQRIIGAEQVEAIEILRRGALKPFQMAVGGVLVRIGVEPNAELFHGQLGQDERGYIKVTSEQETSVENVFAIGDLSNPRSPTVSSATGAGATAAKVLAARLGNKR